MEAVIERLALSQRAMLEHRAALVEELYGEPPSPRVILSEVSGGAS